MVAMINTADLVKSETLEGLVDSEHLLARTASERYGHYYFHAREATVLLSTCITSVDITRVNFARFFSYTKKHHLLAMLSTIRLHKVQAAMDLRQALEASAWAAYALAHTDQSYFVEERGDGALHIPKRLTAARNKWLAGHFSAGSAVIKEYKDRINETAAHAGLVYSHQALTIDEAAGVFDMPFFDKEDLFHVYSDLWLLGSIGISIMDLLFGVKEHFDPPIEFEADFPDRFTSLYDQNKLLRQELHNTPRHKRIDARVKAARAKAALGTATE
jgi:hypothetical protein